METKGQTLELHWYVVRLNYVGLQPFPTLVTWKVVRFSSETATTSRFQMCGLEAISMTRHNRWGPDSSLKKRLIFVWPSCVPSVTLWTVTHYVAERFGLYIVLHLDQGISNVNVGVDAAVFSILRSPGDSLGWNPNF